MASVSVGIAAAKFGVNPRLLTDWFYRGVLDTKRCPIEAGRRSIPIDYLPQIAAALKRAGKPVIERSHSPAIT